MDRKKIGLLVSTAYYSIMGLGLFLTLRYLLPVLLPFIAAYLIAALLRRPIAVLKRRFSRLPHTVVALGILTLFYAFLGLVFTLIIRSLAMQLIEFLSTLPSALNGFVSSTLTLFEGWLDSMPAWLSSALGGDNAGQTLLSAVDTFSSPLLGLIGSAGSAAVRLPSVVLAVVIAIIASFFITLDFEGTHRLIASLFPEKTRLALRHAKRRTAQAALHLLRTYGKLMLITFGELCAGFWLISLMGEKIDYVVPLALIISLVDVLPVLGVGTVLIPWALAVLVSGNSRLCFMLLGLCAVMYIVRNALESRLVGQRFGLHPALTLLALYVGGRWFGLAGVFALPLILIVVMQLREDRKPDTASAA